MDQGPAVPAGTGADEGAPLASSSGGQGGGVGASRREVTIGTALALAFVLAGLGLIAGLAAGGVAGVSVGRARAADEYEPRIATLEAQQAALVTKVSELEADLTEARARTAITLPGVGAIPRSVDELRDLPALQRPYLGVSYTAFDPGVHGRIPGVDEGVYVSAVEPGSPADMVGIQEGDVIVSFDGTPTLDPETLIEAIARRDVGDAIELVVVRDGRRRTVNPVLAGRRLGAQDLRDAAELLPLEPNELREIQNDLRGLLDEAPADARERIGSILERLSPATPTPQPGG